MGIDKIAAAIHKNLAEINSEAMYGLHHRSKDIQSQVITSGAEIRRLRKQADEAGEDLKRMKATNDELLLALQEQRRKFEVYVQEVKRKLPSSGC